MTILKPYLLLACAAFTVGFVGYWALGRVLAPAYGDSAPDVYRGPISTATPEAPPTDAPLVEGKRI